MGAYGLLELLKQHQSSKSGLLEGVDKRTEMGLLQEVLVRNGEFRSLDM